MSIPVDLDALAEHIARCGPSAFVVTNSSDGPPHISSVVVTSRGAELSMPAGRRTRANAAARPDVALIWPRLDDDYCLIVDATAGDSTPETLVVRPTSAVLHKLANAPD